MNYITLLGKSWLYFIHPTIVIPVIIFCYFGQNRHKILRSLLLLCLSLIINPNLKCLFKVPLPAFLNSSGYAFPSGHMQSACVLWGWLAYEIKNPLYTGFTLILLSGIGYWLTFFGYHCWYDIFGAVITALLLIIIGHYNYKLLKNIHFPTLATLALIITCPLSIPIASTPYLNNIASSQSIISGILIGTFCNTRYYTTTIYYYWKKVGLAIVGSLIMWLLTWTLSFILTSKILVFLICFSQSLWITWGTEYVMQKIKY